ncbi:MAG: ATP-binding protein [Caldilineaceae bacterium]
MINPAHEQDAGDTAATQQPVHTQIDTGGGPYIGRNVQTEGDFVAGDKVTVINPGPPKGLDPRPPAPPQLFVGRQAELQQLGEWLTLVTPDYLRNAELPAGKLGLIYGPQGVGKSSLLRRWLADLRSRTQLPIIAHLSFDRDLLDGKGRNITELSWKRYALKWETLGGAPKNYVPDSFPLDCFFWVTLTAQLAQQSPGLQQALTRDEEWVRELTYNTPQPPAKALTTLSQSLPGNGVRS